MEDLVAPFVFVTRREIPLESDKDQISRGGRHDRHVPGHIWRNKERTAAENPFPFVRFTSEFMGF